MNERKKQILKSIVDAYIDSGEPVGSKYLTSYGNISLSPATIRNEMSELEEMGYLDKPHTSAGRVPSSSAYRLYVDELMENYRLTMEELSVINELARFKVGQLDKVMAQASKVMSEMTHCVTLSFTQEQNDAMVSRYDVVPVDESSFLLVIITRAGKPRSEHVKTDYILSDETLALIKSILNENLCGVAFSEVTMPLVLKMEKQAGIYAPLISPLVRLIFSNDASDGEGSIRIDGLSNLLSYPEFSDLNKLRSIMDVFDKRKGEIRHLLSDGTEHIGERSGGTPIGMTPIEAPGGMKIYIGDEESSSALADTSMVFCTVPVGGTESVIGILGPKRMDYRKVISTLKQFTENLEKTTHNDTTEGSS